jgi:hypothetical protein
MLTLEKVEVTLESNCTCEYYDENDNLVPSYDDCFGCWEDSVEYFNEAIFYPWYAANNYHDNTPIKIVSPNLGWMRRAGYCDTYAKEILDKLKINGDFTLRFTLDGNTLTCVRSSHDEMGAYFEFELREEEEY